MEDAGKKVVFSMKEVGEHTAQDDCWMVIEGKVGPRFLGKWVLVLGCGLCSEWIRIFIFVCLVSAGV